MRPHICTKKDNDGCECEEICVAQLKRFLDDERFDAFFLTRNERKNAL